MDLIRAARLASVASFPEVTPLTNAHDLHNPGGVPNRAHETVSRSLLPRSGRVTTVFMLPQSSTSSQRTFRSLDLDRPLSLVVLTDRASNTSTG